MRPRMIVDKSMADVLTELHGLIRLRAYLIGLIEKGRWPKPDKAEAVASYKREIAALKAAIDALSALHNSRVNSTGKCAPRPSRVRLRGAK
jgi:hypothetical protein